MGWVGSGHKKWTHGQLWCLAIVQFSSLFMLTEFIDLQALALLLGYMYN